MRTVARATRVASAAARWGCLAAVLLLIACSSRSLRWQDNALRPDGRTITLTRYREAKDKAYARCGNAGGFKKHTMLIGATLAFAHKAGGKSDTRRG